MAHFCSLFCHFNGRPSLPLLTINLIPDNTVLPKISMPAAFPNHPSEDLHQVAEECQPTQTHHSATDCAPVLADMLHQSVSWRTQHKGFWFYYSEAKELPCTQKPGCVLCHGWNILPCSVLRYALLFERQSGSISLETPSMIQGFKRLEIRQSLIQHSKADAHG